jgi:hypothetical protein
LNAHRRLADELAALPIFSVPRSSALLNYLAVLEVESLMSARSHLSVFAAHRQAVESSAHAIPAILERHCFLPLSAIFYYSLAAAEQYSLICVGT